MTLLDPECDRVDKVVAYVALALSNPLLKLTVDLLIVCRTGMLAGPARYTSAFGKRENERKA